MRKDMKRAKPGVEGGVNGSSFVDGFADTRKDPIKRKKIHRVLDFLQVNKDAYRQYLHFDEMDAESRIKKMEEAIVKRTSPSVVGDRTSVEWRSS